ncbi:hypothetical protein QYM36_001330 [Artemia franciscana]|nr:hypothetical protein QYM36_001330 [Artemia franciscana]
MSPHNDCSVESDLAGAVAKLAMVQRSSSTESSGSDAPVPPVHVTIEPSPSTDDSEPSENGDGFESESTTYFDATSDAEAYHKGDSGVEVDQEPDFVIPDEQKVANIVEMVEFYFSDAYILKDAFLLKHVRRHKEGYISLKLISSFKKVKHETRDWRQVAFACRKSDKLEVNDAGTKVRRVAPLPEIDQTTPSRTIVAIGISQEKASIEGMAELFSKFGPIASIRILRPGTSMPAEVRSVAARNPDMTNKICALIEFECTESAKSCSTDNYLTGLIKIVEVAKREPRKTNKNVKKSQESSPNGSRPESPSIQALRSDSRNRIDKRKRRNATHLRAVSDFSGSGFDTPNISSSDAEISPHMQRRQLHICNNSSQNSTPSGSPFMKRSNYFRNKDQNRSPLASSPEGPRYFRGVASETSSPSRSPWIQRRINAADDSYGRRSPQAFSLSVPSNVFRYPLGPDGTKGFHDDARRGRFSLGGECVVTKM